MSSACYVTRWRGRNKDKLYLRNLEQDWLSSPATLIVAEHGDSTVPIDAELHAKCVGGKVSRLPFFHEDRDAKMGRLMVNIFEHSLHERHTVCALMDDDACYTDPKRYFESFEYIIRKDNVGATGPVVNTNSKLTRDWVGAVAPYGLEMAPDEATCGSQVYSVEMLRQSYEWWMNWLPHVRWHGDFMFWMLARSMGMRAQKLNMYGFQHEQSHATTDKSVTEEWYKRRLAIHVNDYTRMLAAIPSMPGTPEVRKWTSATQAAFRRLVRRSGSLAVIRRYNLPINTPIDVILSKAHIPEWSVQPVFETKDATLLFQEGKLS